MTQLRGASVRLIHNPERSAIEGLLTALKARGCNAVAVIPHHYVYLAPGTATLAAPPADWQIPYWIAPDVGQDPAHPFHNTPDIYLTYFTCKLAKHLGFQVLLKPHVDSYYGGWRGYISVTGHSADWTWAYRYRFLARYIDIAHDLGLDLCMGTELVQVTKDLGATWWVDMAAWIRKQGFSGPLTYAANWGWEADAEYNRLAPLWPHLDYVGVDAYFPLMDGDCPLPITAALIAGCGDPDHVGWHRRGIDAPWCPRIDEDLLAAAARAGKPLLFTEIGYPNTGAALLAPGADPPPNARPDATLQTWAAAAFAARWRGEPALAGWYWWEAWLERPAPPVSHDILDQPASALVWGDPAAPALAPEDQGRAG